MAHSVDEVLKFLHELAGAARAAAQAEFAELEAFAGRKLAAWDVGFYAERLQRERFNVSQEELRPYFPLPRVLAGLFEVAAAAVRRSPSPSATAPPCGTRTRACSTSPSASGQPVGSFYLDAYARPHKRSGAWMDECVGRKHLGSGAALPVAYLVCNFLPPGTSARRCLPTMTCSRCSTSSGTACTTCSPASTTRASPASTGWPGTRWSCPASSSRTTPGTRRFCSASAATTRAALPLPAPQQARLIATRSFHSGLQTMRQVEFALFDFRMHTEYTPERGGRILEILREVRREVGVVPVPDWNRFPNSFGHIFAGGYAAGYYSYKWAEVLAADAFAAFEESGVFDRATAQRFLDAILSRGGSRDALDAFIEFRGRRPDVRALLKQHGILGAAPARRA